jgi:sugar lactone lactonase YvrE
MVPRMRDSVLRRGVLVLFLTAACGSAKPVSHPPEETAGSGGDGGGGGAGGGGGTMTMKTPDAATPDTAPATPDAIGEADTAPGTPDASAKTPDATADSAPMMPMGEFPLAAVKMGKAVAFAKVATQTEGPSFRDGSVYFASDSNGLVRADETGKLWKYHPKLNPVGTYYLSADGSMLVCEKAYTVVQIFKDGSVGSLFSPADHTRVDFCNDLTIDAKGDVYFSDPHSNEVWRMSVGGVLDKVLSGMNFPNGVEVDPASKFLYVAVTGALVRIALPETGNSFPAPEKIGPAGADGMAFDPWGHLWMSLYSTGALGVFDPMTKQMIATVPGGGVGLTNITFAGEGTIYTTVADHGLYKLSIPGVRGFLHPGATKYTIKQMLDLKSVNDPL